MNSSDTIYLDHAAATPLDDVVLAAMMPYFSDNFYNPSSPYEPAVQVRRAYESARKQLATVIGAKADEIIITAGATESINLAVASSDGHIVTSAIEHPAVLEAAGRRQHSIINPQANGIVDSKAIAAAITDDTELVTIALANSELGTIQPIRKIAEEVAQVRRDRAQRGVERAIMLHCDASQGFGQIDIHVARLGVDMLTLNAGKIYGPKQVGLLWVRPTVVLKPQVVGGGQERGLRSGTENVAGVIGFAKAAELAAAKQHGESKRLSALRDKLQRELLDLHPTMHVLGSQKRRLPGHLSVAFEGLDAERLIFKLEAQGVLVATGSACSANKHTASHVLTAIGLEDNVIAGSIRISLGRLNDDEQISRVATIIADAVISEYQRVNT